MHRRTLLRALGAGSASLASGCLGGGERDPRETTAEGCSQSTETETPQSCGDEWKRVDAYTSGTFREGTGFGFELTVEPTPVSLGDCVTVRLANASGEPLTTGIKEKYDIHRETDDGWRSVLFTTERAFIDPAIEHSPGDGFVWTRRLTRAGLSRPDADPPVRACEPLRAGTYRFVYWGVGDGEYDGLAATFEVRD